MKKYLPMIMLLVWATPVVAVADGLEPSSASSSDNRIKTLVYDEAEVYTITTKYGYQTNVVFAPEEEIQTISMGDRSLWQIIPTGNRLFIRPMDDGVTTNMTIITNKRSYQFDLKSLSDEKNGSPIYVAKFTYPKKNYKEALTEQAPFMTPVYAKPAAAEKPFVPVAHSKPVIIKNNYNYTYTGEDAIAPVQVFDDGRSTYIKYKKAAPSQLGAFAINPDSSERSVPLTQSGNEVVIDEIFATLRLKQPAGTITVYNEVLNPK